MTRHQRSATRPLTGRRLAHASAIGLIAASLVAGAGVVAAPAGAAEPAPAGSAVDAAATSIVGADVRVPGTAPGAVSDWITARFYATDIVGVGRFLAPENTTVETAEMRYSRNDVVVPADVARVVLDDDGRSLAVTGPTGSESEVHWGTGAAYLAVKVRVGASVPAQTTLDGGRVEVRRAVASGGAYQGVQTFSVPVAGVVAQVDSVDVATRTARLSGRAAAHAAVSISGADAAPVTAGADGRWQLDATGLSLGANTIRVAQRQDGLLTGETTVEVDLSVPPVTADVVFPADRGERALIVGSASPGADVVVADRDGTEIERTVAQSTGAWGVRVPAPGAGGDHLVRIRQEIDGQASGEIERTIAYGEAVSVGSPTEGATHSPGPLPMSGRGEDGAEVVVRERGLPSVLGTADVVSGTWALDTSDLVAGAHVLEVSQTGRGANTTVATVSVTVEAGGPGTTLPFTIAAPQNGSTVSAPFGRVAFSGTGAAGAQVVVRAGNGRDVIDTTVGADGTWHSLGLLGFMTYQLTTIYTAPGASPVVGDFSVTVVDPTSTIYPFSILSPAPGATVVAPNGQVTFIGIGAAGAHVQIVNDPGGPFERVVAQTTVRNDGTWAAVGFLSHQLYTLSYSHEPGPAGGVPAHGYFSVNVVAG